MSGPVPPENTACAPTSVSKFRLRKNLRFRTKDLFFFFFLVEARYAPLDFAVPPPRETCAPKEGK